MSQPRRGFTLIEVLLTTVLAATLLAALWSLLSMYSTMFETGQAKTEQSQLARTLLRQISDDLHSTITAPPPAPPVPVIEPAVPAPPPANTASSSSSSAPAPTASAPAASPAAASASAPSAGANVKAVTPLQPVAPQQPNNTFVKPLTPQTPQTAGGGSSSSSASSSASVGPSGPPAGDRTVTIASKLRPAGLYGTESYLQIEVYQPTDAPSEPGLREPSTFGAAVPTRAPELRTIIYSFDESQDPAARLGTAPLCLTRRELDWEKAHPASKTGVTPRRTGKPAFAAGRGPMSAIGTGGAGPAAPGGAAEPVDEDATAELPLEKDPAALEQTVSATVPEVSEFALRYFDGSVWSTEWDSAARQGLPVAVEVTLNMHRPHEDPTAVEERTTSSLRPRAPDYRLLIHLATATPPKEPLPGLRGKGKAPGPAASPAKTSKHAGLR